MTAPRPEAAIATATPVTIRAIAVRPGRPGSAHLWSMPAPRLDDVPEGRGVLVRVLRVGLDGTDRDIEEGLYGTAPPGEDALVVGHESLGEVVATGPAVPAGFGPGSLVVATVRRPGTSVYDRIGRQDLTLDETPRERGISEIHGFLAEQYVEDFGFLVRLPEALRPVGVLLEPLSVVEKGLDQAWQVQRRLQVWQPARAVVTGAGTIGLLATLVLRLRGLDVVTYSRRRAPYLNAELVEAIGGLYVSAADATLDDVAREFGPPDVAFEASGASQLAFELAGVLARNGVLVVSGVTPGDATAPVAIDRINRAFVLGNRAMVGTVNASIDHFRRGVEDMTMAEAAYPGWLERLLTTPFHGLDDPTAIMRALASDKTAIKVFVEVAAAAG
jgi:threonine dehydrogenase-like Zn-dependent dehydrogenase